MHIKYAESAFDCAHLIFCWTMSPGRVINVRTALAVLLKVFEMLKHFKLLPYNLRYAFHIH